MNKHIILDNLTAKIGGIAAGKKKFFSQNCTSYSFKELIEKTIINIPLFDSEGTYEIKAKTLAGELDTAYKVEKWLGPEYPTILFHHGNNERPFDYSKSAKNTFYTIFVKSKADFKANLIVVRAPFHNSSLKEYRSKMVDLKNFMAMISTSVKMNEVLISDIRKSSDKIIITSGISLGGFVTNLHRSFYNSSNCYAPLLAGTYLGELFLQSKFSVLTGKLALRQADSLRQKLNFNIEFDKVTTKNVFPLLARYDQFIIYDIQSKGYMGHPITTIEKGHNTGALNTDALRKHILDVLENITN